MPHSKQLSTQQNKSSVRYTWPGGERTIVELQMNPDDYVLEFVDDDGRHECMLGIAADDSEEEDVRISVVANLKHESSLTICSFVTKGLRGWTFGQVRYHG